jgi:hypothetical protein
MVVFNHWPIGEQPDVAMGSQMRRFGKLPSPKTDMGKIGWRGSTGWINWMGLISWIGWMGLMDG